MKGDNVTVVSLHEHQEFLIDCAVLLNKQWKRSLSARIQSLERSFKELPDSLLLIERTEVKMSVIGHSRLTRVLEDPNGCWIGSVVIAEERRNQGYGKYIMKKSEEYAKSLNFSTVYLNTQDQQGFYEHLGYIFGETVSSINFQHNDLLNKKIFTSPTHKIGNECQIKPTQKVQEPATNIPIPPPPPPPPLLLCAPSPTESLKSNLGQYWMKKSL